MKLIIMGAGYVGQALLENLQQGPHELFITTTKKESISSLEPYGKKVILLNSNKDLKEVIDSCDGMVILVAPGPFQSYKETYLNTAETIRSILKERDRPFYLLYTSSTSVCEGSNQDLVTEETPLCPKSDKTKILIETEACYLSCNADVCLLRLGGIYGPNRELIDRARKLSGKEMMAAGQELTNHIHLNDIVGAICFCLEHSLTGIYHLVNDDHPSRDKLYSLLCKYLNLPPPLWNSQDKSSNIKISNQKIKQAGYIFKHPLIVYPDKEIEIKSK